MIELKGMTWNHPRGYDPLAATAAEFTRRRGDVTIKWDRRPLQDFGDVGADQLASQYDLMVIDHPHVGDFAASECILPLDGFGRYEELAEMARQSVANSHQSYNYRGRQWALAIDTAAHVSAYRTDLLDTAPTSWDAVGELARTGRVIWPLKPVDSLMSFFSLCGNFGQACSTQPGSLVERSHGMRVLQFMCDIAILLAPECLSISPPEALDRMSQTDQFSYCPLLFGYSNYARLGFRPRLISFTNIPRCKRGKPEGSILGGAGLAISSRTKFVEACMDYAFWIASGECQRTLYVQSGGQPANAAAWEDDQVNRDCHGFFRNTRDTLNASWIRPRFAGYIDFQIGGGNIVHDCLLGKHSPEQAIDALQELFETSIHSRNHR